MLNKSTLISTLLLFTMIGCGGGGGEDQQHTNNTAPIASNTSLEVKQGTSLQGSFVASDADGDSLTYSIVVEPASGTLELTGGNHFTYTPAFGFKGEDNFEFKANDGKANSNTAIVTINVTDSNTHITSGSLHGYLTYAQHIIEIDGFVSESGELLLRTSSPSPEDGSYYHLSTTLDVNAENKILASNVNIYIADLQTKQSALYHGQGTITEGEIAIGLLDSGVLAIEATISYENKNYRLIVNYQQNEFQPSMETISGLWKGFVEETFLSFTVDTSGLITGSSDAGCIFNGTTSIDNEEINLYRFDIVITSCADSGHYTGFGNFPFFEQNLQLHILSNTNSFWVSTFR